MTIDFNDPEQANDAADFDKEFGPWRLVWIIDVDGKTATSVVADEHGQPLELCDTLRELQNGAAALVNADAFIIEPGDVVDINTPNGLSIEPGPPPGRYRVALGARSEQPNPDTGKALLLTLFDKRAETLN